jgi:hypothetical protein
MKWIISLSVIVAIVIFMEIVNLNSSEYSQWVGNISEFQFNKNTNVKTNEIQLNYSKKNHGDIIPSLNLEDRKYGEVVRKKVNLDSLVEEYDKNLTYFQSKKINFESKFTYEERKEFIDESFDYLKNLKSNKLEKEEIEKRMIYIDLIRELSDLKKHNSQIEENILNFLDKKHIQNKLIEADKAELLGLLCKINLEKCINLYTMNYKEKKKSVYKTFVLRELQNLRMSGGEIEEIIN